MKRILQSVMLVLGLMACSINASSQNWQMLDENETSVETEINLLSSADDQILLEFNFTAYALQQVTTEKGIGSIINIPNCSRIKIKGAPDLPKISQAVAISDFAEMELKIIDSKFIEIENVDLLPSKGILTRDDDPKLIPYEYGEVYSKNEFYPANIAKVNDPYNIRNVSGQNVMAYPVQYNPVTKTVRIYTKLVVELVEKENSLKSVPEVNPNVENDEVFNKVLNNHFINYSSLKSLSAISEGSKKMLIVCNSSFMDEMAEFVSWKESIGYTVSLVNYSTIGSSSSLKTFVKNQYNENGISYLLLVGDHAQLPSSSTSAGYSDNNYGYTSGSDHYLDIFVGRFSAENSSQLQTQIDRTIYYERDVNSGNSWFKKALSIASNEGVGGGGDDNQSDEQHMDHINSDLSGYGYNVSECYQDGGSTSQMKSIINNGVGIINYVGHGGPTNWVAPDFDNSDVSSLSNSNELPFVISVACVVGEFTDKTCFAEAWLRATNNGSPTGAVVFCGSTINQSWSSPMCAQDEMNDLLVGDDYITYGGMFVNGLFQMIDEYGNDGEDMADTWTVFGDPSLQMRTPGNPNGPNSDGGGDDGGNESYCTSKGDDASYEWIAKVQVGSFSKSSGSAPYSDFTSSNISVNAGSGVNVTLTPGFGSSTYNEYWRIWIDYNDDGDFSDANELAFDGGMSENAVSGTMNIPLSVSGTHRMRVSMKYNAAPTSCEIFSYGEVEDYSIVIAGTDTQAPSAPSGLTSSNVTENSIALSWNASSDNVGVTGYDVYKNGSKLGSSSGTSSNITGLSSSTTYTFYVKAKDAAGNVSGASNSINVTTLGSSGGGNESYCDSEGDDASYEWIAKVQVGAFKKTSGSATYSDFTSSNIAVSAGSGVNVTLTPGFGSSTYDEYWRIWIDYNDDGDFTDANELAFDGGMSESAVSGTMNIPSSASGTHRMRVSMKYNAAPTSCEIFSYGEVEDYSITISGTGTGTGDESDVELANTTFENGWGIWTDGGSDCFLYTGGAKAYEGNNAANIQDNAGTSSSFYLTNGIDVHTPGFNQIEVKFNFYPNSMEDNEDFWLQYFDGSAWITVAKYKSGTDFTNKTFYLSTITINEADYNFPTGMKIRFMCDASGDGDDIYIDNIVITGKYLRSDSYSVSNVSITELYSLDEESEEDLLAIDDVENSESIRLYPNPASDLLYVETSNFFNATITLYTITGSVVKEIQRNDISGVESIDVSMLTKGVYFISVQEDENRLVKKFIKE